jgi:Zinc carboxypeptidase
MKRLAVALSWCVLVGAAVPAPETHFGHRMGADRKLLDWDKVVSYFQHLAKSSDRISVTELGKSTEGRPFIAATIAAPETLRNLERYREIQARLADPRTTTSAQAEALVREGKPVVVITCSIHSTEVASTATAVEFAYRLLTEDKPKFRQILQNTIFVLVPSLNPDGVDIVTNWYRRTLGTPYEGTSPPELYHKYVGHDNNRDWYIFSQIETRLAIAKIHNFWRPQIVYDIHQQGIYSSRMFVPPWMDPIEPNIDPIIAQMCNAVGAGIAADLTAAGRKGIAINAMYDFWSPARHYQAYHGGLRILSESASARLATPVKVRPDEVNQTALGYSPRERSWNHLEPWPGGDWTVRDIVDDQLIAMESVLFQAAMRREDFLRNSYRIGKHAVNRASPAAFVIPANQRDPGAARKLLETLAFGRVEIYRARAPFEADGKGYPSGSYIIRMQQPYGSFAKTLLERQSYPDIRMYPGGPPQRPYDVTAHTLPLLMGVDTDTIKDSFAADSVRADEFPFQPVSTQEVLSGADTESWRAVNSALQAGHSVWRDAATGDFHLQPRSGLDLRPIRRPRIALYKSHVPAMDEGWTRWLLEQFGFPYTHVLNRDLQAGSLRERFDVILFPSQRPESIQYGYRQGTMPEQFTGGVGDQGAKALKQFAENGGTVVLLNDSASYAVQHFGTGAKDALAGVSNREFYAPGALLNVRLQKHPLTLGLPENITVWFEDGPAFVTTDQDGVVASYPESHILASGWLLGEKHIARRAAVVDEKVGSGHVILFGIRPQYRAQSYQTFKLLFNSLLYFE